MKDSVRIELAKTLQRIRANKQIVVDTVEQPCAMTKLFLKSVKPQDLIKETSNKRYHNLIKEPC